MTENFLLVDASGNATEIIGETKIGRSKTNEVVLTDPLASRHHATLYMEGDVLMIRDEQSVNGTIVNRGQIYDPVALKDRDTIQFGDEIYTVRAPLDEAKTVMKSKETAKEPPAEKKIPTPAAPRKLVEPTAPPPAASDGMEEPLKKNNTKKILLIAGGALLVLCVCCIVVGVVASNLLGTGAQPLW